MDTAGDSLGNTFTLTAAHEAQCPRIKHSRFIPDYYSRTEKSLLLCRHNKLKPNPSPSPTAAVTLTYSSYRCNYASRINPTLNRSSEILRFKHSDTIEIRNVSFLPRDSRKCVLAQGYKICALCPLMCSIWVDVMAAWLGSILLLVFRQLEYCLWSMATAVM